MHRLLRAGLIPVLCVFAGLPAHAQWQVGAGPGLRYAAHDEYDAGGHRLVRESGWLPGIALQAAYTRGALTWRAGAEAYRGDIDYGGRTQTGVPATSTTSTRLAAVNAGVAYALAGDVSLLALVETDRWRRDIAGTATAAGLQETYRSTRLFAGAARTWRPAAGRLTADAALFLSTPEHMRVAFSGRYDPAHLDLGRARGLRLGLGLRPANAPWLELSTRYDRARTPRSGDAPLTENGQFRGTITQPEHTRQALTFAVSAMY
ncbi:MAG: hypothetical protein JF619_14250 [Massilia sp.]|nr:hypothetical protein [Massilia sp.]